MEPAVSKHRQRSLQNLDAGINERTSQFSAGLSFTRVFYIDNIDLSSLTGCLNLLICELASAYVCIASCNLSAYTFVMCKIKASYLLTYLLTYIKTLWRILFNAVHSLMPGNMPTVRWDLLWSLWSSFSQMSVLFYSSGLLHLIVCISSCKYSCDCKTQ